MHWLCICIDGTTFVNIYENITTSTKPLLLKNGFQEIITLSCFLSLQLHLLETQKVFHNQATFRLMSEDLVFSLTRNNLSNHDCIKYLTKTVYSLKLKSTQFWDFMEHDASIILAFLISMSTKILSDF